jgi:hypothetical protein
MKPEIENLKAWIYGKSTTGYQRALGMREFEQLLSYVNELEQLRQTPVSGSVCCGAELIQFKTYGYDECSECGKTYRQQTDR